MFGVRAHTPGGGGGASTPRARGDGSGGGRVAAAPPLPFGALTKLPPLLTDAMLQAPMRRLLPMDGARLTLPGNRHLLFASQDNPQGGKNQAWLDARLRCVWTGSLPSSATFYSFSHRIHAFWLNKYAPPGYEKEEAWASTLSGHPVLQEVLTHFKHVPSQFTAAAQYYMSVGSRLEDTAIAHYIRHFCPHGVAVEEYLRTFPYAPDSPFKQGGSPDGLLLLPLAGGGIRRISMEVKCAAACQNSACKRRRAKLASTFVRVIQERDSQFTALYESYCNACACGWPVDELLHGMQRHVARQLEHGKFKFARTDRLTCAPGDIEGFLAGGVRATDVVFCTNDAHKTPHKALKPYYCIQMMLEMFHQRCAEARMVCFGFTNAGAAMNAFGLRFDMACLVAGVQYMETERRFAEHAAEVAAAFLPHTLRDPDFPQAEFLHALRYDGRYNRLMSRLHQNAELMVRMSERACLGADTSSKAPFWCPFHDAWNKLDEVSRDILAGGWVDTAERNADGAGVLDPERVFEHVRDAWCTTEHARTLNFQHPDSRWLRALSLEELFDKYRAFTAERQALSSFPPPPLSAIAPLLAPQGWLSEPLLHAPKRSRVRVFSIPTATHGTHTPQMDKARWQFQDAGSVSDEDDEPEAEPQDDGVGDEGDGAAGEATQADPQEAAFRRRMRHVRFRRLLTKWSGRNRPRKHTAPLALGAFDRHGGVYMNYFGEEDERIAVLSAEDIPDETWIRCVVSSLGEYNGTHYADITRVLLEVDRADPLHPKRKPGRTEGQPTRKQQRREQKE